MERLTIGRLARLGGVNLETVRYYERQGLLAKPPRTASEYRAFPVEAARRLRFIKRGRRVDHVLGRIDRRRHDHDTGWLRALGRWSSEWWLGDTTGILVVTPLILSWSHAPRFAWRPRRVAEATLLFGLLLSVGFLVFGTWTPGGKVTDALAYLSVPLLVWAAFRFGQRGAIVTLTLVSGMAIWGTVHAHGPFVQHTLNESLLLLQTFVGVLAVTALALSAVLVERRQAEQAKAMLIRELEHALEENKTLDGLIPICSGAKRFAMTQACGNNSKPIYTSTRRPISATASAPNA